MNSTTTTTTSLIGALLEAAPKRCANWRCLWVFVTTPIILAIVLGCYYGLRAGYEHMIYLCRKLRANRAPRRRRREPETLLETGPPPRRPEPRPSIILEAVREIEMEMLEAKKRAEEAARRDDVEVETFV